MIEIIFFKKKANNVLASTRYQSLSEDRKTILLSEADRLAGTDPKVTLSAFLVGMFVYIVYGCFEFILTDIFGVISFSQAGIAISALLFSRALLAGWKKWDYLLDLLNREQL